jgi:hypothetical protein
MDLCKSVRGVLLVSCLAVSSTMAVAQESAPAPDWTLNGFVSAAYTYNFDSPDSGSNTLRVFDFDDDTFSLDVAEIVVQRPVSEAGQAGFRADLVAGSSIPSVSASYGLFRDEETGVAEDFDLQQAFVSYIAPVGRGLRLDAGKFVTAAGAELIEGYDGYNDNYSRSILFGYAIPFTHTGIKASYGWSDKVSTSFMVVNGWDVARDNNDSKTIGATLGLTPVSNFTAYVTYIAGAERADSNDMRHLLDIVGVVKLGSRATFTVNYDHASEEGAAADGGDADWNGLAGYLRFDVTPSFALTGRAEFFNDEDGVRTGTEQKVTEFTLTPSLKLNDHFVVRSDFRIDSSDEDVFEDGDDSQTTAALNVLYTF